MAAQGRTTTRAAQAAETRQRLIDAAIEHFANRHYDEVAVSDIAKSAGVAHGLLFHYFGNKRGIYLEAIREAERKLDVAHQVSSELPPGRRIRAMYAGHLEHLATHRGLAIRLILGGRGSDPEAWELFEAERWRAINWIATVLGLDSEAPALRMMLRGAVGAIDETSAYWLDNGEPFDIEPLVEALVQMTAAGLRGAAQLDPGLAVDRALELLLDT